MHTVPASQALELCEALIWHAMAEHRAIEPRGFDTIKAREAIHRQIDDLYDELAILRLEVAAEVAS